MKHIVIIINALLLSIMAYFCVEILYKKIIPDNFIQPETPSQKKIYTEPQPTDRVINKNQYDIIIHRNLFKVEIEEKNLSDTTQEKENRTPEKLEATTLNLVLWGTVTGESALYAVIEDKKTRQQALYQTGDQIQGAEIKNISRHEVVLTYQGKDQILEMEADDKNIQKSKAIVKKPNPDTAPLNKILANGPLDNIKETMDQIKFRPHFSEGETDGVMVYGIRPDSVFSQFGLRNGDIVKDINGSPILSADDASRLFAEIEKTDSVKLTLFRRGQIQELSYEIGQSEDSIPTLPDDKDKVNDPAEPLSENIDKGDE